MKQETRSWCLCILSLKAKPHELLQRKPATQTNHVETTSVTREKQFRFNFKAQNDYSFAVTYFARQLHFYVVTHLFVDLKSSTENYTILPKKLVFQKFLLKTQILVLFI